MKTKLFLLSFVSLLLFTGFSINLDKTSLEGIVIDKNSKHPLDFAYVKIFKNGKLYTGTQTDLNGKFHFTDISAGIYDIEASYIGYKISKVSKFEIKEDQKNVVNFELSISDEQLDCVRIVEYKAPPVTVDGITVTAIGIKRKRSGISYATKSVASNPRHSLDHRTRIPITNTESYKLPKENKFVSVQKGALSTFSIDVDRASYSNVRRFINHGKMPPKNAVRVEEMVNYFKYDFDIPKGDKPFHIFSDVVTCPWNKDHQILHVALNTKTLDKDKLPPTNLVFLIDVSGSMSSPNKLPLVVSSFKLLLDQLRPDDKVAIVVYAGSAGCPLPSTKASEKKKIIAALNNLKAGGSTAGGEGIQLAYKIAKENFIEGGNNRVILATDGDFNVGISSNDKLEELISKKRKDNIFLSVLGYGMGNYKSDKMQIIADKGNGNHAYIDNMNEARKVFMNEFMGTLYTLAKDVKIQIEFNPAFVQAYRLIGYENRMLEKEDFNNDRVDAGETGVGHSVTALYEIIPNGAKSDYIGKVDSLIFQENKKTRFKNNKDLGFFKIRYKEPEGSKSKKIQLLISPKVTKIDNANHTTQFAVSVAQFGLLLKDSMYKQNASYENVLKYATANKGKDIDGFRAEFINLVKTAKAIDESIAKN